MDRLLDTPAPAILDSLIPQGGSTQDGASLSFEFIPQSDRLIFRYVFGSNEYPTFVGSPFNDVFGLFLNGKNVAQLPGTDITVSINTVNSGQLGVAASQGTPVDLGNSKYFVDNSPVNGVGPFPITLAGFTTVLSVNVKVEPGVVNQIQMAIADVSDGRRDSAVLIQAGSFFAGTKKEYLAVGAGPGGGPHVKVYDLKSNELIANFYAYNPAFRGGVRAIAADLNGDNVPEIITAAGPGGGPHIRIFDIQGNVLREFMAYDVNFRGGVNLAVGDTNGDGVGDMIAGAGPGGGPHVRVFSGMNRRVLQSFFADDTSLRGGVDVATADFNNDGYFDIVTSTGSGWFPQVRLFDALTFQNVREVGFGPPLTGILERGVPLESPGEFAHLFAYSVNFRGGSYVTTGDVNGDGIPDIITGAGPGGGPHVRVFDGSSFVNSKQAVVLGEFYAFDPLFSGGVDVTTVDVDGDGIADIVTCLGAGDAPEIRIYRGKNFDLLDAALVFSPEVPFGVYVG